jgi:hypothetical protein
MRVKLKQMPHFAHFSKNQKNGIGLPILIKRRFVAKLEA